MKNHLKSASILSLLCMFLFAFVYPAVIRGIAYLAEGNGNGVTISVNGKIVGFENVGQNFSKPEYFWGRPSAVNYNAGGSGGSNHGNSNPNHLQAVEERLNFFLANNPSVPKSAVPSELLTASGSGLDPHISPNAALVQVARIAKIRNLNTYELKKLIKNLTEEPLFGFLGTSKINVLKLNVALDQL